MNATELKEVTEHAEKIKNDGEHTVHNMDPGDMWCQGDVGIVFLGQREEVSFANLEEIPADRAEAQLAPGNTQGSRHCIDDLGKVTMYRSASGTELDGPRIDAPTGFRVNHPEHGDVTLPPGKYAVIYQQVWVNMQARRALD